MSRFDSHNSGPGQNGPEPHDSVMPEDGAGNVSKLSSEVIEVDEAPPLAPQAPLSKSDVKTILGILMVAMFLAALDQTIVATALPTIGREFQDVSNLSWVITAYLVSSTAVAPLFGTLSDIYGRKWMIVTAMSLFLAGSVLCAMAPNMLTLILARGLQGLGGGGILPIVQTIISDVVTPRERGQYQAYFSMVWMAAGVGGPVLGGLFAEHLHWSMIFWINLPLGAVALLLLLPKMKLIPVYHRRRKVDWTGGLILMASAIMFLLVLTGGGSRLAWLSPTILAMVGAGLLLAVSFIWHARRSSEPFLPLSLLGGPVVPFAIIAGGCGIGTIVSLTVLLPLYYETVYGLSASHAGLALLPVVAVSVPGAALAGHLMTRARHYKLTGVIGTICSSLMMLMIALLTPQPLWVLLVALSLFAFGIGTVFPITVVSIQNAVSRHQVGTATGAMNFFRSLMASFSVAAFSTILLMALGSGISIVGEHASTSQLVPVDDMVSAFRYVFFAASALMGVGAVCLLLMEERPLAGPTTTVVTLTE